MDLKRTIEEAQVPDGDLAVFWLGQAGFVFKTHAGQVIYLDPYLSDAVERLYGFRRLSPAVIEPGEVRADYVICTHGHEDHLDIDALPEIARSCAARIVTPPVCIERCVELGIGRDRCTALTLGTEVDLSGTRLIAVYADHGSSAPEAVGVVLDFGSASVYYTGDTSYRPEAMREAFAMRPDVVIPVINGAYGNLNEEEAGSVVKESGADVAIPCHFWTFAEHNGDPGRFAEACARVAPSVKVVLITPGRSYEYRAGGEPSG